MKSTQGEPGLKHMRQIRDWIVNHPDPQIRNLLLITCTPAGGVMGSSEHIHTYMNDTADQMQPAPVLTQIYSVPTRGFYSSLQLFADWCRQRDISIWVGCKTWAAAKPTSPTHRTDMADQTCSWDYMPLFVDT